MPIKDVAKVSDKPNPLKGATDQPSQKAKDNVSKLTGKLEQSSKNRLNDNVNAKFQSDNLTSEPSRLLNDLNPETLNATLEHYDADDINELTLGFDDSVIAKNMSKQEAMAEMNGILNDMIKAKDVPGIATSIENLSGADTGASEWHGYRFELHYAAEHASEIEQVNCENWIDVKMKDGSYRELKSFTYFGSSARKDVIDQLEKDVSDRGATDITVIFEKHFADPQNFIKKLQNDEKVKALKENYHAKIRFEVFQ